MAALESGDARSARDPQATAQRYRATAATCKAMAIDLWGEVARIQDRFGMAGPDPASRQRIQELRQQAKRLMQKAAWLEQRAREAVAPGGAAPGPDFVRPPSLAAPRAVRDTVTAPPEPAEQSPGLTRAELADRYQVPYARLTKWSHDPAFPSPVGWRRTRTAQPQVWDPAEVDAFVATVPSARGWA